MSKDDSYFEVMGPYVKYWESFFRAVIKTYPIAKFFFVGRLLAF
jgi:hypothetical protein